jgi:hypothetical protein
VLITKIQAAVRLKAEVAIKFSLLALLLTPAGGLRADPSAPTREEQGKFFDAEDNSTGTPIPASGAITGIAIPVMAPTQQDQAMLRRWLMR